MTLSVGTPLGPYEVLRVRMHRHTMVAAVLLVSVLAQPSRAQVTSTADINEGDRKAVADTVHAVFRAAKLKQIERLEAYHAFGPEFTKFDEFGLGREDAAATQAAERLALARVKAFQAEVQELKVDVVAPAAAIATFILAYSARTADGEFANRLRSTLVLAKREQIWKIVHEHYSPLLAGR